MTLEESIRAELSKGIHAQLTDLINKAVRKGYDLAKAELIHCKDCKHRPILDGDDEREGFNLVFPTERCPCQCADPWYNWMPKDNWYCGNAERKTE